MVSNNTIGTIQSLSFAGRRLPTQITIFDDAELSAMPVRVWFGILMRMIVLKMGKRRTRRHLGELTDDQLRDVGLTRAQAITEVRLSYPAWYFDRPASRNGLPGDWPL